MTTLANNAIVKSKVEIDFEVDVGLSLFCSKTNFNLIQRPSYKTHKLARTLSIVNESIHITGSVLRLSRKRECKHNRLHTVHFIDKKFIKVVPLCHKCVLVT